jgi:hypothetical protein
VALVAFSVAAVDAATYGYVPVKGKRLEELRREVSTLERLIKEWPAGEVLAKIETSSGLVFKKHDIVVLFAGNAKDITQFLTKAPYEGDFLRGIVVRYTFGNYVDKAGQKIPGTHVATRNVPNIREAVKAHQGVQAMPLFKKLVKQAPDYAKVEVVISFYSLRLEDGNFICNFRDGTGQVRSVDAE